MYIYIYTYIWREKERPPRPLAGAYGRLLKSHQPPRRLRRRPERTRRRKLHMLLLHRRRDGLLLARIEQARGAYGCGLYMIMPYHLCCTVYIAMQRFGCSRWDRAGAYGCGLYAILDSREGRGIPKMPVD